MLCGVVLRRCTVVVLLCLLCVVWFVGLICYDCLCCYVVLMYVVVREWLFGLLCCID